MIIGNNFNRNNLTNNNNFENSRIKSNTPSEASPIDKNVFTSDIRTMSHSNPLDKGDMSDKSLAMLHERLEKGLISMEEFNKKCEQLGRLRNK